MMKRFARTVELGSRAAPRESTTVIAAGTDFDVFTGGALLV
jgi:hypothetical protein